MWLLPLEVGLRRCGGLELHRLRRDVRYLRRDAGQVGLWSVLVMRSRRMPPRDQEVLSEGLWLVSTIDASIV
jgi:hypothetical protein